MYIYRKAIMVEWDDVELEMKPWFTNWFGHEVGVEVYREEYEYYTVRLSGLLKEDEQKLLDLYERFNYKVPEWEEDDFFDDFTMPSGNELPGEVANGIVGEIYNLKVSDAVACENGLYFMESEKEMHLEV